MDVKIFKAFKFIMEALQWNKTAGKKKYQFLCSAIKAASKCYGLKIKDLIEPLDKAVSSFESKLSQNMKNAGAVLCEVAKISGISMSVISVRHTYNSLIKIGSKIQHEEILTKEEVRQKRWEDKMYLETALDAQKQEVVDEKITKIWEDSQVESKLGFRDQDGIFIHIPSN